jgi:hypothetical protein
LRIYISSGQLTGTFNCREGMRHPGRQYISFIDVLLQATESVVIDYEVIGTS